MASRLDPSWWQGGDSLKETIEHKLQLPKHRERWKYTRPQKAFDLFAIPDGANADHSNVDPGRLDIDQLLEHTPEGLYRLLQGQSVQHVEASTETVELADYARPVSIDVPANSEVSIQRTEVNGTGEFVWLNLAANASAEVSLNALTQKSFWDCLHIHLKRDARLILNLHTLGAPVARQDIHIHCEEPGADVTINAAANVAAASHLDQQVTIHHKAPNTSSRQQFHTAAGAKSQVTFNGRIHIYEQCPGVDAHLSNKNIALADTATINTKPELEIYTDDVVCSHGATVGALDEAELFYCTSRGISPDLAKRMLGFGFLKSASSGPIAEPARRAFESVLA